MYFDLHTLSDEVDKYGRKRQESDASTQAPAADRTEQEWSDSDSDYFSDYEELGLGPPGPWEQVQQKQKEPNESPHGGSLLILLLFILFHVLGMHVSMSFRFLMFAMAAGVFLPGMYLVATGCRPED
mmetsp:Transcript_84631/g.149780  ORF Transcript_84631/g.149780 Transcript_84631/m.149780 type:complete len:127 (+) Transcript_84631:71-451(+)|eukprot:CAMPEP_0197622276 /NCGR_PEP_ID=MMETSP1338-20131121/2639_1 /TAXON_ID=43686 ORGANISM="Pelagodinium beii, Strain RCC1491" /NCGR_SAMPLE_ID=MMETSP1338 /ASSEMBLY_ACC=CAM_ASM_000754 /LENGTH=126 /DNA_ID=CAMNT_0043191983 /DNA_START=71 /DNA_END=451 /DNA_ORIENTATION=+